MECTESQLLEVQSEVEVATVISNTAEYNQLLPKHLGYLTYRLKSEHFLCSFFTSITNLCIVQEKSVNFGTIESGSTKTGTTTVTSCPSGYNTMIIQKVTSWCVLYASSVSGTTLTLGGLNITSNSHTCSAGVYVIYYPSTWNI